MSMKQQKKKKGQSTLEYIILVTGIIAVLLIFLRPAGIFSNSFNRALVDGSNGMEEMSNRLRTSRPSSL